MTMKGSVLLPFCLLFTSVAGYGAEELVPAGSLIQCTVSEPNLSSKTTDVGDPVLCQASPIERYGRSVLPYGSYLVGRFAEYKDPGHFVGKGWMELKFERLVVPPGQVFPLSAKVVNVPGYPVDKQGRIHGKGHATRDIVEWSIPILWPIDLLALPGRGPRPRLKTETRLTLKVMDDLAVPVSGVTRTPMALSTAPSFPQESYPQEPYANTVPVPAAAPPMPYQIPLSRPASYQPAPAAVGPVAYARPRTLTVLMLRDGNGRMATDYWFEGGVQVRYRALNGAAIVIPMENLDLDATVEANRRRGVPFSIRSANGY
jgi:hypothetical protein